MLGNSQIWINVVSLDYTCNLIFFLDGEAYKGANCINPDRMPHITLFHQGIRFFPLTQQCFEKSVCTRMSL